MTGPADGTGGTQPVPVIYVVADPGTRERTWSALAGLVPSIRFFGSGRELLAAVQPDDFGCVLLDLDLPDLSGFDVIGQLKSAGPDLAVVAVSERLDVPTAVRAMRVGAANVLERSVETGPLREAVSDAIKTLSLASAGRRAARKRLGRLTTRQREVLELAVAGLTNEAVATKLGIGRRSVERQRSTALAALGVETLQQVTALLMEAGSTRSFPPDQASGSAAAHRGEASPRRAAGGRKRRL